jgi:hypothetical protein
MPRLSLRRCFRPNESLAAIDEILHIRFAETFVEVDAMHSEEQFR